MPGSDGLDDLDLGSDADDGSSSLDFGSYGDDPDDAASEPDDRTPARDGSGDGAAAPDDGTPVEDYPTPAHPLLTVLGRHTWIICLPLVLVAMLPASGGNLSNPVTLVVGGTILGLLVYQAFFLVVYRYYVARVGVYLVGQGGPNKVETVHGALLTALLNVGLVGFVLLVFSGTS